MRDAQSSQFQMLFRLSKKHLESGIISDVQPSGASQPAIVEFREIENSWTDVIKDLNCQQHPQQPHWWILSPSITYRVMSLSLSLRQLSASNSNIPSPAGCCDQESDTKPARPSTLETSWRARLAKSCASSLNCTVCKDCQGPLSTVFRFHQI